METMTRVKRSEQRLSKDKEVARKANDKPGQVERQDESASSSQHSKQVIGNIKFSESDRQGVKRWRCSY
jgi:hypothetical protein